MIGYRIRLYFCNFQDTEFEQNFRGQKKQRKFWPEMSRNIYDDKVQRQFHLVFYTIFLNIIKLFIHLSLSLFPIDLKTNL